MPCSGLVIFLQNLYRFSPTIDISFEIFRTLGQGISKLGSGEKEGDVDVPWHCNQCKYEVDEI